MADLAFTLNGESVSIEVTVDETLVWVVRERLGLTGTVVGCGWGQCGACTVLVDGAGVLACMTPAVAVHGCHVVTVEGLASDDDLHPMQAAFLRHGAIQCGYCTPGMVLAAIAAADRDGELDEEAARAAIAGNVCRCTGYSSIVAAIVDGSSDPG